MSEQPVKKLLGSISYGVRLEILEKFDRLKDVFVRIELFDRDRKVKDIVIDNFELLVENITVFWEEEAKLEFYPRKMAAWLSDYLTELGYPDYNFEYVYKALTQKLDEDKLMEELAQMIDLTDPDIKPKLKKLDIDIPDEEAEVFLSGELESHLEEAPSTVRDSIVFVDQTGKISALMSEQEIAAIDETQTALLSTTVFENPTDTPLTDVQINKVIPYHYKVTGVNLVGFEGIEPTKKLLDDGLQLTWIVPEIKPKQETKIEVNLERRISRTILMNIAENTNVINTYFNIVPFQDKYSATNSFTNIQPDSIDHLVIEDEIPSTFNLLEIKPPEDDYIMDMEREGFEQLLKWQYDKIATEKVIRHLYYLIDQRVFLLTQLFVKEKQDGSPLLEINRLIEPNIRYYEIIVSYYLKFHKPVKELYIKERIPENVNVTFLIPHTIEKSFEIVEDKTVMVWKIIPDIISDRFEFGYICTGESIKTEFPIDLFIPKLPVTSLNEEVAETTEIQKKPMLIPEIHQILETHQTSTESSES